MTTTPALIAYLQGLIPLDELPDTLGFSNAMWQAMENLWQRSIANLDMGLVIEWGGLLEISQGRLRLARPVSGTAAGLRLIVPSTSSFVSSFHTHPDSQGYTGIGFSGADFADMVNQGERISLVQSGRNLFALLRTEDTPVTVPVLKWRTRMNSLFEQAYRARRSILAASLIANRMISQDLGLAFYYGRMFRQLVEVYRP